MNFYDSTRPKLIPAGAHACLYFDGKYAATKQDAKRFAAVRWITVLGNHRDCGVADYEAGNEIYAKAAAAGLGQRAHGHAHPRSRLL